MKNLQIFSMSLCFCFGLTVNTNADTVYLKGESSPNTNVLFNLNSGAIRSSPKTLEYRQNAQQADGDLIYAFCGDFGAATHSGLTSGRPYKEESLTDYASTNTDAIAYHAGMIQDLYDYAYAGLFSIDTDTGLYDLTSLDMLKAQAFQITLWELIHETTGNLSLNDGDFQVLNWAPTQANPNVKWDGDALKTQVESMLACLTGDANWADYGFSYVETSVSIFTDADPNMPASSSQLMIYGSFDLQPVSTPEPGTLLIFAVGTGCILPLARRRMKKNA